MSNANWRIAVWVAVVIVALSFLWLVRGVLPPFLLALVVSIILEPLVRKLGHIGVPRPAAVFGITAGFFALIAVLIVVLTPRVADQINEARQNVQSLADQWTEDEANDNVFFRWNPVVRAQPPGPLSIVDKAFEDLRPALTQFGLPPTRRAAFDEYIVPHRTDIAKSVQAFLNGLIGSVGGALSTIFPLFFTPLFVIMMLLDLENMKTRAKLWIPPSLREGTLSVFRDVSTVFQRYLQGMLSNISMYGATIAIVLSVLGVPYSILLALMSAIFYLVPILGAWASAITITTVVILSGTAGNGMFHVGNSLFYGAIVFGVFTMFSATWDTLITPRVVGSAIDLHPLVAMFVVFCGAALFGLPGMVLAYPLAGVVKVTLARIMAVANAPVSEDLHLPAVPPRHRSVVG